MGYITVMGTCITCGALFSFNPHHVPSTRVFTGQREPVCPGCMEKVNQRRIQRGLEPFPIHPQAYEAASEEEL